MFFSLLYFTILLLSIVFYFSQTFICKILKLRLLLLIYYYSNAIISKLLKELSIDANYLWQDAHSVCSSPRWSGNFNEKISLSQCSWKRERRFYPIKRMWTLRFFLWTMQFYTRFVSCGKEWCLWFRGILYFPSSLC